jgi:feruloyl esterase
MKYAVYEDPHHSFDNFSVADIEYADTVDPGGISTWSGDLSGFRNHGGKLLAYHGSSDAVRLFRGQILYVLTWTISSS